MVKARTATGRVSQGDLARWSPPPLLLPFPLRVGLHKSDSPTHLISSQFSKLSLHSPYPTIPTQGWFKPPLPACIPTQVFVHPTFPLDQMHMTSIINMFQSDFECIYCKSLTNKKDAKLFQSNALQRSNFQSVTKHHTTSFPPAQVKTRHSRNGRFSILSPII